MNIITGQICSDQITEYMQEGRQVLLLAVRIRPQSVRIPSAVRPGFRVNPSALRTDKCTRMRTDSGRTSMSVRRPSTVGSLSVRCPCASVRCLSAVRPHCPSAVRPGFLTCPSAERTDCGRMRTAADGMSPLLLAHGESILVRLVERICNTVSLIIKQVTL